MKLEKLFSPVRINTLELPNRAVMPAMGTGYGAKDNTVSDRLIAYLEERARGGVGLIITEVFAVDPRGRGFGAEVSIWSDDYLPGLQRLTDSIHRAGSKIAAQLHHAGRETFQAVTGALPEAPSAIPSALLRQPCEAMTRERIREIINAYAYAAERAKRAGFDAVEIHGAHGYLLTQFLSPFSNQRDDEYGGSPENRARIVIEILQKTRELVGPDYPVIIRVSATEAIREGYDFDYMLDLAPKLARAGADAIHVSIGVYTTPGNLSVPSMDTEPGFNLERARQIRGVAGVPIIGVGRIHDPRLAEEALVRGDADLIAFGRQHLADPFFLAKAREGRFDEIRPCLACNQGCIERLMFEMKSATCAVNPRCGSEIKGEAKPVENNPRLMIIGAGPAGLQAAISAAARGYCVDIYDREDEPGGQLRSASTPPHKEVFRAWTRWAFDEAKRMGVAFHFGTEVTAGTIEKIRPERVILASGARSSAPAIPGLADSDVADARDVLLGHVKVASPAVILGAGYVGMETADFLVERGVKTIILDARPVPPVNALTAHGYWLNRRIKKGGGEIILNAQITSVKKNFVRCTVKGEEKEAGGALIIRALGAESETELEPVLDKLGIPFLKAGDVMSPRRLIEAVHEGFRAGNEI